MSKGNSASSSGLGDFADSLKKAYSSGLKGQPEAQLTTPVQRLIEALAPELGVKGVHTSLEAPVEEVGRPDIAVAVDGLLCGYIELKAPGTGITKSALRGRNKDQFKRFATLPNLIYTNGNEWLLYRGEEVEHRFSLSGDATSDGAQAVGAGDLESLSRLLRDFLFWKPATPGTPRGLAEMLAPFCRILRDDVREALGREGSNVSALAREWRSYLFPEASDFQFADAYAQTLTYAMLLARFSGQTDLEPSHAAGALRSGHALL